MKSKRKKWISIKIDSWNKGKTILPQFENITIYLDKKKNSVVGKTYFNDRFYGISLMLPTQPK